MKKILKNGHFVLLFFLSVIIALPFALVSCDAFDGERGKLTLNIGTPQTRQAVAPADRENMTYNVTLDGPVSITETFTWPVSASFNVPPGNYTVTVRAVGNTPDEYIEGIGILETPFPDQMLRAVGVQNVSVRGGGVTQASVSMKAAAEVTTWKQLQVAVELVDGGDKEEVIVIKNSMATTDNIIAIDNNKKIILAAEGDVTIERATYGHESTFFDINGVGIAGEDANKTRLTIGGFLKGRITLDGDPQQYSGDGMLPDVEVQIREALIDVYGGTLVLDGGTVLRDNVIDAGGNARASAIYAHVNSLVVLNDCTITGNKINHPASPQGCVAVVSSNLIMNGGLITGNIGISDTQGEDLKGYGVYVGVESSNERASFIMNGGSIFGNTGYEKDYLPGLVPDPNPVDVYISRYIPYPDPAVGGEVYFERNGGFIGRPRIHEQ